MAKQNEKNPANELQQSETSNKSYVYKPTSITAGPTLTPAYFHLGQNMSKDGAQRRDGL